MAIRDLKHKFYYPSFTIDKKEYEITDDDYLNEVKEHFIKTINKKTKERKLQGKRLHQGDNSWT